MEVQGLRQELYARSVQIEKCNYPNVQRGELPTFLPLNIMEKVTIISPHNYNYLILTIQAVDIEGGDNVPSPLHHYKGWK